jgi:hypothetical protein
VLSIAGLLLQAPRLKLIASVYTPPRLYALENREGSSLYKFEIVQNGSHPNVQLNIYALGNPTLILEKVLKCEKGATRFRRKLSRLEGMQGATCPQSGGKLELPINHWHLQPSSN